MYLILIGYEGAFIFKICSKKINAYFQLRISKLCVQQNNKTLMQKQFNPRYVALHIILLIALLVPNFSSAQNQVCTDEVSNEISHLYHKYSRLNKTKLKTQIDSLILLIPDSCNRAKTEANIVLGRYHKDNSEFEIANTFLDEALASTENDSRILYKKHILTHKAIITQIQGENNKGIDLLEAAYKISCNKDSISCLKYNLSILVNKATIMLI